MATPDLIGADLPEGTRFVGTAATGPPRWRVGRDAPQPMDLDRCVACGLCLPHCPTYRLTAEESASPRGRIATMRAVHNGQAQPNATVMSFMDLCLACRACEDVCPSHVPFGRMMEAAREQVEMLRPAPTRLLRRAAFQWLLPHPSLIRLATLLQPVARPFLPKRIRRLLTRSGHPFGRLPRVSEPDGEARGTVALLAGCAQDRWFHEVNLATVRVLTTNGWRVTVPRDQACCGALAAHNGRLSVARRLAKRAARAFEGADVVLVNSAGCAAHMVTYDELQPGTGLPVRDLMSFLFEEGLERAPGGLEMKVAYHDACHALRGMGIHREPRAVLANIPSLEVVDIPDGGTCCGAAGIYNVTQPGFADALGKAKAEAIIATGAQAVASANPGCTMHIAAALRDLKHYLPVLHPVELLDLAYGPQRADRNRSAIRT